MHMCFCSMRYTRLFEVVDTWEGTMIKKDSWLVLKSGRKIWHDSQLVMNFWEIPMPIVVIDVNEWGGEGKYVELTQAEVNELTLYKLEEG